MESHEGIEVFLSQLKRSIESRPYILVEREACEQFMASKALSMGMLTAMISNLKPADCWRGPQASADDHGSLGWTEAEFMPVYRGDPLFLKISLSSADESSEAPYMKVNIEKRVYDD